MNLERFKNSTSGHILDVKQGDNIYQAFIPSPLPPNLELDIILVNTLSQADRKLGELAGLGRTLVNPQLLIRPFMNREAVLSSRIEGTQADIADLYAYQGGRQLVLPLPGFKPPAPESDIREVFNYVQALEYGIERLKTLPLSLRLIRELHQHLMAGVRGEYATPGEFRRLQNWIGHAGCKVNEAEYVPPPVSEMLKILDELEKYIHSNDQYPPLIRIAFIHYQFEAIHPFIDGNGRIGRLLISLLLISWNLLPLPLLYLSAHFERHRDEYIDLLQSVSERSAWREWLLFFLRGVIEEAEDASNRAKQLQDLQIKWRIQLQQARVSGLIIGIVDSLFDTPIISSSDIQRRFEVSHPTAREALRRLEDLGIVQEVTDRKRNKLYFARTILEIV